MGARGPRPAPAAIKRRQGITAPSDINLEEPLPKLGDPVMPDGMSVSARAVWRHVLREQQRDVILNADRDVLRLYCEAVGRYIANVKLLDKSGSVIRGRRDGLVVNPLHRVVRDEAELVLRLGRELALTPTARAGMRANQEKQPDLADIGPAPRHLAAIAGGKV